MKQVGKPDQNWLQQLFDEKPADVLPERMKLMKSEAARQKTAQEAATCNGTK